MAFPMYRAVWRRLFRLKNDLWNRGFTYDGELLWHVLRAVDSVIYTANSAKGGDSTRLQLENLRQMVPDDFVDEVQNLIDIFDRATMRRRVPPYVDASKMFLEPDGVKMWVTGRR